MSSGARPARLIAVAAASVASVAVVSPGPAMRRSRMPLRSTIHASLVSTRASRSAFVTRPSGTAHAPADDRDRQPGHATRSQATGWPCRRRSPSCTSIPMIVPSNGLRTDALVPGPSTTPISSPSHTAPAGSTILGRNTPTAGAMIDAFGNRAGSRRAGGWAWTCKPPGRKCAGSGRVFDVAGVAWSGSDPRAPVRGYIDLRCAVSPRSECRDERRERSAEQPTLPTTAVTCGECAVSAIVTDRPRRAASAPTPVPLRRRGRRRSSRATDPGAATASRATSRSSPATSRGIRCSQESSNSRRWRRPAASPCSPTSATRASCRSSAVSRNAASAASCDPATTIVLAVDHGAAERTWRLGRAVVRPSTARTAAAPACSSRSRLRALVRRSAAARFCLPEPPELREILRAVRLRMVVRRRGWDRRVVGIPAEQQLRLDVAVERLLGAHPPRGCEHDEQQRRDRPADDQPDEELNHEPIVPGGIMQTAVRARVVEWQTRRTQNPLLARACGFESHLGHLPRDVRRPRQRAEQVTAPAGGGSRLGRRTSRGATGTG